jgi:quercetin dioxygenase-like cupin family protein
MARAGYTVKNIETIAESGEIRARLYTLAPDDIIPWHYHSNVTDWYFCLGGTVRVETRAPPAEERVDLGGRYAIPP